MATPSETAPSLPVLPDPLFGRYRVGDLLGRGGFGSVLGGVDVETGEEVAIKVLHPQDDAHRKRIAREVAALRRLALPGVVRLRDHGELSGTYVIVMDRVWGHPFPGRLPRGEDRWPALRDRARGLLTTLAAVHAAGIIHRDLKPENVLTGDDGAITLLDFGIARGPALGSTITATGFVLGTPRYMAPELLRGQRPDPRADLYAVGVMLFELLVGRPPVPDDPAWPRFVAARLTASEPRLSTELPGADADACRLVDALLRNLREERPASALDALDLLSGVTSPRDVLPRLGAGDPIREVRARLALGRTVAVWGPPGTGRSRVLREVAEGLVRVGVAVRWTAPGQRPCESLVSVLGVESRPSDAKKHLRLLLENGVHVFADDALRLDRWTREILDEVTAGPLVQVRPAPGAVETRPLTEEDLRALFHGPERILHLPSLGAALLHRRTGGIPARVHVEVLGWVTGGWARWDEGRLRVTRAALDHLGGAFRPTPRGGSPDRPTPHRSALGTSAQTALTWIAVAEGRADAGVLQRAMAVPTWEAEAVVEELERAGAVERLPTGALVALDTADLALPEELDRRRLAEAWAVGHPERLRHLLDVADPEELATEALALAEALEAAGLADSARPAWTLALELGSGQTVVAALGACVRAAVGTGTRADLEAARRACQRVGGREAEGLGRVVEASLVSVSGGDAGLLVEALADPSLSDELRARLRVGLGVALGKAGRLGEAAEAFREAAEPDGPVDRRLAAAIGEARTRLAAGDLVRARERAAWAAGAAVGLPVWEADAEVTLAEIAHREGRRGAPDVELLAIVRALGATGLERRLAALTTRG